MGYMHRGRALRVISAVFVLLCTPLYAQEPPPFLAAYSEGKAYILLTEMPRRTIGFNIYREEKGEFKRLNSEPVRPVKDPILFREIVGDDYEWVKNAVNAENEFQTLRRVVGDPGTGFAISLASLGVARATGRLFVDTSVVEGKRYKYRIAYLDFDGEEFLKKDESVKMVEITPQPPKEIKLTPDDGRVRIDWDYPPYSGKADDITSGFNIYRKAEDEKEAKRINRVLVLRQEGELYRIDREVINGIGYTYYLTAVDFIKRESKPSKEAFARPEDKTPPLIPEGVETIEEEGKITISWKMNLELDLSYYDICRSTSPHGDFEKINKVSIPKDKPIYIDTNVVYGVTYFYGVKAVDLSGNESILSGAKTGHSKDLTPPPPPMDIGYEVKEHTVNLNWKAPKEPGLLGYYVYRGDERDKLVRIVGEPIGKDTLKFFDPGYRGRGLWPGKTYYYAVSAVDLALNESERALVDVKIPDDVPPLVPLTVYAKTTSDGKIRVEWPSSPSPDATNYRVYRGEKEGESILLKEVGKEVFSWLDESVEKGKKYFYQISAVDSVGNEGEKTKKFSVISRDTDYPPPPTGVKAVVTEERVAISWDRIEIEDFAGYNVYRSDMETGVFQKLNEEIIKGLKFVDRDAKEGFYYRVTSLDTSGNENKTGKPVRAR